MVEMGALASRCTASGGSRPTGRSALVQLDDSGEATGSYGDRALGGGVSSYTGVDRRGCQGGVGRVRVDSPAVSQAGQAAVADGGRRHEEGSGVYAWLLREEFPIDTSPGGDGVPALPMSERGEP